MPKVSRRQRALRSLRRGIRAALISENIRRLFDDEDVSAPDVEDDLVMDYIEAYWTIDRSRYLNKRDPLPRAPDMFEFWLYRLDESRFKEDFRVTRLQFMQVVELIESHPVFYNESNVFQTPVWRQLMVALYQFGCDGNGAAIRWAGCSHDARLMTNCELQVYKDEMFEGDQYLLVDSGFAPDHTVVPVFKKPRNGYLTEAQSTFNKELSKIRVWNEHCIGVLKGRFFSLKGLRLRLRNEHDGEHLEIQNAMTQTHGSQWHRNSPI
ncbi:hypothetical protein L917_20805 [Phytophthora nicotianae]|uniref:DDE Tnp4 domain-containing protein n=1 Tax=Phytophthora nicotianae TaxID=4792 RepID=W2K1R6_PHYNI|nr:hypothetical protein L917_20805 [Phytophthora nicotianae]